jgi:FKBP-type peptidyl-prolyl cis-trans isomerase (trigger factor)
MKSASKFIRSFTLIAIFCLVGIAITFVLTKNTPPATNQVVAIVDGDEITREQLNLRMQDLESDPSIQVPDTNQAEIRAEFERLVLEEVIIDFLLAQEAKKQGLTADKDEINNVIQDLISQFDSEEMFEQELAELGLNKRLLKQETENQLLINQYYAKLVEENDIEISPEEIEQVYQEEIAPQEDSPAIEGVALEIYDELRQQKLLELLTRIVEELKESTEIEIFI